MTGAELKAWREAHSLTQVQLAALLGVTGRAVSHWECNTRTPAPYLGLALRWLDAAPPLLLAAARNTC